MGFIYSKSVKERPFRINLSKSGIGLSTDVPGFRVTQSSRGHRYTIFNIADLSMRYQTSSIHSRGDLVPSDHLVGLAVSLARLASRS